MLELLHLSFRKILHQRNHKFGCMRTDPPNLEISISFSAVRELHFEVSICTYLDKRNNMNSTKTFGFMTLFFLPNWWIILSFFFFSPMWIERLQFFILTWEMWVPNSFTIWSWFGLQAYQSLHCNHMAYKCIQRMRARFSDTGKIITPFDLWLLTPIKQKSLLCYPGISLKQRAWRTWSNSRYIGRVESKTALQ